MTLLVVNNNIAQPVAGVTLVASLGVSYWIVVVPWDRCKFWSSLGKAMALWGKPHTRAAALVDLTSVASFSVTKFKKLLMHGRA